MIKKTIDLSINHNWLDLEDNGKLSKKLYIFLVVVLVVLSIGFWMFYSNSELILAYNDARSRLNIARRIVDSLQPGFAQIGSVWLPLFHILELPLVWNYYLWQSGFAGSIISMASYVAGGIFFIKLLNRMNFTLTALLFAFTVYALNPNMLFMQSIPMTESLLMFLAIASIYYLYIWSEELNHKYLILSSIFIFLSSLTRYDGWFLLLASTLFVIIISFKKRNASFVIGNVLLFLTLASFGVILWIIWNKLIFNDPLYFVLGPFSAKSQQDILNVEGRLFSKGNLVYSTFLYLVTVLYNSGIWIGIIAIWGGFMFYFNKHINLNKKIVLSLLLVPFIFNIFSLYAGHSVIHIPHIPPYTWFNDRYGLMVLPAIAIMFAYIVSKSRLGIILASMVVIFNYSYMYIGNNIITIEDGTRGSSGNFLNSAGIWLKSNAKDGLILTATSSNDALVFTSGLPLKRFIVEGSRLYWQDSLADPTKHAKWIVMKKGDLVETALHNNRIFLDNYSLVYKDAFSYIYVLDVNRNTPLTKEELP